MYKILKGEIFKIIHQKYYTIITIIILLYSLLINYLYYKNNVPLFNLYNNFSLEYMPLFIILTLLFSINIIIDEYNYNTREYLNNNTIIYVKYIVSIINIFIIIIYTFLISSLISILVDNTFLQLVLLKTMFIGIFKIFIILLYLNSIGILIALIIKKSSYSLILSYLIYLLYQYIIHTLNVHIFNNITYIIINIFLFILIICTIRRIFVIKTR